MRDVNADMLSDSDDAITTRCWLISGTSSLDNSSFSHVPCSLDSLTLADAQSRCKLSIETDLEGSLNILNNNLKIAIDHLVRLKMVCPKKKRGFTPEVLNEHFARISASSLENTVLINKPYRYK